MRSGRKLKQSTLSPRPDQRLLADQRRLDELVGLAALVGGRDGLHAASARGGARGRARAGRRPLRCAPSGGRGPSPSSGRRPSRRAPREPGGRARARTARVPRVRAAVSRPSVKQWITRSRTDERRRQLDQRAQVLERGVHAAVGDQPEQVHARRARRARAHDRRVLAQRAVGDRLVDARQILADHGAGAEVEVADLGVAHLAFGQPDGAAAGGQRRVRVGRPQLVEHRRARQRDRVARAGLGEPPAVEHDQADAGTRQRRRPRAAARSASAAGTRHAAAATIAANDSASSEAPPTSAPSTSGSASSSAALSGLTEPP